MRETQPFGILLLLCCAVFDVLLLLIGEYVIFPLLKDAPYLPKAYAQTYTHLATLRGPSHQRQRDAINAIVFSPDGQTLATGGDKAVHLWDVSTGNLLSTLKAHSGWMHAVAFSPDGKTLASVSEDRASDSTHATILWDARAQMQKIAPYHQAPYTIRLWDIKTGTARLTFTVGLSPVTAVEFSPDSTKLLIASQNGFIDVWDNATGRREQLSLALFAHDVTLNGIGTIAFAASPHDKIITRWTWKTGGFIPRQIPKTEVARHFSLVQWFDNFRFAGEPAIGLNTGAGRPLSFLIPDTYRISALAFSPDSKTLASGGRDRDIRLCDVADGKIQFWDANTGHLLYTFNSPGGNVNLLTFSPDSKTLASVGEQWRNKILLWNLENYRLLSIITAGKSEITAVTFAPDSLTLASAHSDGTVHLWDITGKTKISK